MDRRGSKDEQEAFSAPMPFLWFVAFQRLERAGLSTANGTATENSRRAKYLTSNNQGRKRLPAKHEKGEGSGGHAESGGVVSEPCHFACEAWGADLRALF